MTTFTWIVPALQILIALGLLNVWLVRFKKPTAYRGGSAQSLPDEFAVYGLPKWFMYVVGFLKIAIAIIMIVTVLVPNLLWLGLYAAAVLVILMIGAIAMHIKVRDAFVKMLPAIGMLVMAVLVIWISVFGMPSMKPMDATIAVTGDTMEVSADTTTDKTTEPKTSTMTDIATGNTTATPAAAPVAPSVGRYVTMNPDQMSYSAESKTVLFFAASWCPSCRILDRNILQNMSMIPADVTIIKVDYDTATDLKKQYGITRQHTLVQVNESGEAIHTWSGGSTLASLLGQIK